MIIVTGASRGIGKAICEFLIQKEYKILGVARNVSGLSYDAYSCDISSDESLKKLVTHLKERKIKITGLINCAGIASMNMAVMTPTEVSRKIIETNLLGTIFASQLIAPLMMKEKNGVIINFSTIAVPLALKGEAIYIASKAGVESFTRVFAKEMADFNIAVNCISPGPVDTDLLRGVSEKQIDKVVNQQVITKKHSTDSICKIVEILLSQESRSLSGQVFHIGGV